MSKYYGDYRAGQTIRAAFNTVNASAAPTTLSAPSVVVTKDGTVVTPSGGVTLTADADTVTGFNRLTIDTSIDAATFTAGADYKVRLGGTANVGGTSVVGSIVAEFSVQNRAVAIDASGRLILQPTQTGVTIPTVTTVGTLTTYTGNTPQTGDVFARLGTPAGASIAADIATRSTYAGGPVASVTGNVGGSVASVAAPVTAGTVTDKTGYSLTQAFPAGFSTLAIAAGKVAATVAAGDNADSAAIKATIGIAGAGLTALGDARLANLDATVSSRLATSGYTAPPAALTDYQQRGIAVTLPTTLPPVALASAQPNYAPATAAALATLSTAVGTPAQATQIPSNFTAATFGSAGVFAAAALANTPGAINPWTIDIVNTVYAAGTAGSIMNGDLGYDGIAAAGTSSTITLPVREIDANTRSILLSAGTGAGQARNITAYDTATRIATLDRAWLVTPDATTKYILGPPTTDAWATNIATGTYAQGTAGSILKGEYDYDGFAVAGTTSTITLPASEPDAGGRTILLTGGTGIGQARVISSYDPATRIAAVDRPWLIPPDATTKYILGIPALGFSLDLTQPLANVKTGTTGGALAGAWAVAWGNVVRDPVAKLLKVFGFNSTTVPVATFGLDDGTNPATRTLQ